MPISTTRRPIQAARGAALRPSAVPRRMPTPAQQGPCVTATLKRGRMYLYASIPFERDKPVAIDDALIKEHKVKHISAEQLRMELEDLYETITDSDGEKFEKAIFEVRDNQPRPPTAIEEREAQRPRRVREFIEVPQRENAGALRARPNGTGRR